MLLNFISLAFLGLPASLGQATSNNVDECRMWQNVTDKLVKNPAVLLHCQKYDPCTGFDCAGTYTYNGLFAGKSDFTLNFCFGLVLHQCDHPIDMETFIEIPDQNVSFTKKFHDDETYQIPGATYPLGDLGTADAFISVELEKSDDGKFLTIGYQVKVRVTVPIIGAQWPEALQRDVVPPTTIPVPRCDPSVHPTLPPRHKCVPPSQHASLHPTGPTPSNKTCTPNKMGQCGDFSICLSKDDKHGVCTCMQGYTRNNNGECVPKVNTRLGQGCILHEELYDDCGDNAHCKDKDGKGVCTCDISGGFIPKRVQGGKGQTCIPGAITTTPAFKPSGKKPTDAPSSNSSVAANTGDGKSSNNNIVIVGGAVGGAAFLIIIAVVVVVVVRIRRRHRQRYGDHDVLLTNDEDVVI